MAMKTLGANTRALGKRLDAVHTTLCTARSELQSEVDGLDGILHPNRMKALRIELDAIDGAADEIEAIYGAIDAESDELDEQEQRDGNDKEQQTDRIAELESELEKLQEQLEHANKG